MIAKKKIWGKTNSTKIFSWDSKVIPPGGASYGPYGGRNFTKNLPVKTFLPPEAVHQSSK